MFGVGESLPKGLDVLFEVLGVVGVVFPEEGGLYAEEPLGLILVFLQVLLDPGAGPYVSPDVLDVFFEFVFGEDLVDSEVGVPQAEDDGLGGLLLELVDADPHDRAQGLVL